MSFNPIRKKFILINPLVSSYKYISGRVGVPDDDMVFEIEASEVEIVGGKRVTIKEFLRKEIDIILKEMGIE